MPGFSDAIGTDGALVRIEVGVSRQDRLKLFASRRPVPPTLTVTALIDTGAEISCIDPRVIRRLQLSPNTGVGVVNVPGHGGLTFAQTFDISLTILHPSSNPTDHLTVPDLEVAEVSLNVFRIDVLIGRDVLSKCDFSYLGRAGTFSLVY